MRKNRYEYVCAMIGLIVAFTLTAISAAVDPSTLPLIQFTDLSYLGGFRLPDTFVNGDGFTHGGTPITFNPSRNSLFVGSRIGNVAEMAIPELVASSDVTKLPFAGFLQGFYEPTGGTLSQVAVGGASISGLLVMGDRLYGTASIYYDANNTQRVSHYSRATTLSTPGVVGMRQVWVDEHAGFVSGYMAAVPEEWQSALGGPAITGQCCLPVAWRTSWGPSAFAWNPSNMATMAKVPATPLLYYPQEHPTLGHWEDSNPTYGGTTMITGVAVLAGTRTALFFGRTGTGPFCYGNGTSDLNLVGKTDAAGTVYCYDPTTTSKAPHSYPYNYQIWAYDLNDLAAVKAGQKAPWDLKPYGVWPFSFPVKESQVRLGGIGYDSSRQIIYISQVYADKDGYGFRPLIHAVKVGGGAAGAPLPPPDTSPLPPVSNDEPTSVTITDLAVSANKAAPQPAATTITFTAEPTGGIAPHQYKWLVHDGNSWSHLTDWSTSNTFAWTPPAANSQYRVGVWVRNAGNSNNAAEMTSSMDFPVSNPANWVGPYVKTAAVAITANKLAPQPSGSSITLTGVPSGGTGPHQYKWLLHNGAQWTAISGWSTSSQHTWTPTGGNLGYRVGIWVKSAGNTADAADATTSIDYPITGVAAPSPAPAPSNSTARLTAVALTASKPAPQPSGSTITFTAVPNGGASPQQYKWLLHDGASWKVVGNWTVSNTFNWTPATASSQYRFGVWVRGAGLTADAAEATTSIDYPIAPGAAAPAPPPSNVGSPTPTATRLTAVTLVANRVAPQPAGTATTFTATPNGGAAPHQYKWLVHNGAAWQAISGWATSNSFIWTPTQANSQYRFGVWVRTAGQTADAGEATTSIDFPISAAAASPAPPPPAPSPSTGRLTAVALSADRPAPQLTHTPITFTATPNGGAAPQQYKWLIHNGASWATVGDWTTSRTFTWTPTVANSQYRFGVWVRSAGTTADIAAATTSIDFPISPRTITALTAVTLGANKVAPQPAGATVTFTAIANGGIAPQQYKWLMHDGASWKTVSDWSTSSTFNWTPSAASAQYRIGVWVRSAGSTVDAGEVTSSIDFPIVSSTVGPAPLLTAVSLAANYAAPQLPGTDITFTAVPAGGAAPHQYKFLVHDGTSWVPMTGWSTANTFTWTPWVRNVSYRVGVWVRSAGMAVDAPQASNSIDFAIK